MWAGDNDDDGTPVRLYQPILYGAAKNLGDTFSWIGGLPGAAADENNRPVCAACRDSLFLLAQLYVPEPQKRTYQIFGCNRLSCIQGLFPRHSDDQDDSKNGRENNMLCYGGGGVVVCRRWNFSDSKEKKAGNRQQQGADGSTADDWVMDDGETNTEGKVSLMHASNEWATSEDDGNNSGGPSGLLMDDLEATLSAMETRISKPMPQPQASIPAAKFQSQLQDQGDSSAPSTNGSTSAAPTTKPTKRNFPCFVLHSLQEPPAVRRSEQVDPDDVGLGNIGRNGSRKDDAKIQQMLAQYMQEEDDEEILTLLRGQSGGKNTGTTATTIKSGERDERLSATDRALLQYTDRLKRSPQQVLRYSHGGTPLWSIPIVSLEQQQNERSHGEKQFRNHHNRPAKSRHSSSQHLVGVEQDVPPCKACGAPRLYEFQLVPPLLHVLQVDKYAPDGAQGGQNSNESDTGGSLFFYQQGGMDWGNIAVYACSNPACCDGLQEEFCVVQDSIDERFPSSGSMRPHMLQGAAVIAEDSKFKDDDEEDEDCVSNADLEESDDDDQSW